MASYQLPTLLALAWWRIMNAMGGEILLQPRPTPPPFANLFEETPDMM